MPIVFRGGNTEMDKLRKGINVEVKLRIRFIGAAGSFVF